jgi:hypothetical protein
MSRYATLPKKALDLDEVLDLYPQIHQSLAASFDDCPMSALFDILYGQHYSTKDSAQGIIFHRFAAEVMREMQRRDSEFIPQGVALATLEEVIRQPGVPFHELVRVPLKEIPLLRMAAAKFANDNSFSIRRVLDIEHRFFADLEYEMPGHGTVRRTLTGQPDLILVPEDAETVIVDWKSTWALPPERAEDAENPGLSYHGYFWQRFYGWGIMQNYPSIEAVTAREFYARRTAARKARITRADLPKIEEELRILIADLDRALMAGRPRTFKQEAIEDSPWQPQPGQHCFNCEAPSRCYLGDADLPPQITTQKDAERWAAMRQVAMARKKRADKLLYGWADVHGPITIRAAKGRRVLGHRVLSSGKTRFEEFAPDGVNAPVRRNAELDKPLEDAMREAAAEARAAR